MAIPRRRKVGKIRPRRGPSLCVLLLLMSIAGASKNCARLTFSPLPQNGKIFAEEFSKVRLAFTLNMDKCVNDDSSHFIYVKQEPGRRQSNVDYCAVRMNHKECDSYKPQNCRCEKKSGYWEVFFAKTVTLEDEGAWKWYTGDGQSEMLSFDIQRKNNPSVSSAGQIDDWERKEKAASGRPHPRRSGNSPRGGAEKPQEMKTDYKAGHEQDPYMPGNFKETVVRKSHYRDTVNSDRDNSEEAKMSTGDVVRVVDDDDDGDGSLSSSVTTGVVVGVLNIVSIIVVLVVVFMRRRSKERQARRPPQAELPSPPPGRVPDYAVVSRPRPPVPRESYLSVASVTSGTYDVIPAACHSFENETYLVPMAKQKTGQESTYTPLA